jgi:hypothetical protein
MMKKPKKKRNKNKFKNRSCTLTKSKLKKKSKIDRVGKRNYFYTIKKIKIKNKKWYILTNKNKQPPLKIL